MPKKTVFLSSTARDLQEYRKAAYHAIEGLDGYHCVRMEDFGARDQEADEFCAAKVAECDLFVGILGHLYGSCPKGSETSYTEREYNTAVDASIPRLIIVAPEDFPINAKLIESDDKRAKQKSFRERVNKERISADFSSPDNLALKVTQAIQNEITNNNKERTSVPLQRPLRPKLDALIPNQIPRPPSDFKGREDEISEILSNFDKGATITGLRGMAGVGKTALALVLAERLKDHFPDGNLILNLKGTTKNPLSASEAMAQVIHSYYPTDRLPENENELHGLYLSVLAGKRALLLLDNAADKEQVEPLMPPKECAVLITSRNKFTLPGLKERDLDVLPPAEARELLLEIAGRIGDRADKLAKLCGYLPLALRNAASALAERMDLGVAEYEQRLKDKRSRLELVEASFTLSYELLPQSRRKQWCRLSIFPEDFNRDGAAAVWMMGRDLSAKALSDLVKWSLVDFISYEDSEEVRYRLHDLVRLFADSRLESDEREDAHYRHAKCYLKVLSNADQLYNKGGSSILIGLELFDREWANIKAGQAWAEDTILTSKKQKKKDSIKSALQLVNSYPNEGTYILDFRMHPLDWIHWIETALAALKRMKHQSAVSLLGNLGSSYWALGETRRAIVYYEQALGVDRKISNWRQEGDIWGNLGCAYFELGEKRKAIKYFDHSLVIKRKARDRRGEANILYNLSDAYLTLGEIPKAIQFSEQALKICHEIGDIRGQGQSLCSLGRALVDQGDNRKGIGYLEQASEIGHEIRDNSSEGESLCWLGRAYAKIGETQKAIEYLENALETNRTIGGRRGESEALCWLGRAYADIGEIQKSIGYLEQALVLARRIEYREGEGNSLFNMSLALEKLGQRPEAIDHAKAALAIFEQIESPDAEKARQKLAEWQG